ncbi:MAG: zinc ribbon domain-containing protein [Candidatus Marinimicrobia bacterium]|nr:zinc ribbon domain-containing protein [Candidatus Neomarinimicrobiota bacterium]
MSFLAYLPGMAFLVWAAVPLFKKDHSWVSLHMEFEELEDKKQRVYGNIADLEFDYAMGRLSESDFTSIRKSFMNEAGRVIQILEEKKSSELMNRIQKDIEHLDPKKKVKKSGKHECHKCGTKNLVEAKFCMKCGEALS